MALAMYSLLFKYDISLLLCVYTYIVFCKLSETINLFFFKKNGFVRRNPKLLKTGIYKRRVKIWKMLGCDLRPTPFLHTFFIEKD